MKRAYILLVTIGLLAAQVAHGLEVIHVGRVSQSSSVKTTALTSVDVQAGDMVVWSHVSNKKASAINLTFGISVGGTVVIDETLLVTDKGTDSGLALEVVSADSVLGGTDPNPNAIMAYTAIDSGANLDFWVESDANVTSSNYLYIIRPSSGGVLELAGTDAEEWTGEADINFALNYNSGTEYSSMVVIESANALKGTLTPVDLDIVWSNANDGGEPPVYLPGLRKHAWKVVSASTFTSDWGYEFDVTQEGKNKGSVLGLAIGEVGDTGGGDDDWYGYPVTESGWTDTDTWMGWLYVSDDPWVLSLSLDNWIFITPDQPTEGGAWGYITR